MKKEPVRFGDYIVLYSQEKKATSPLKGTSSCAPLLTSVTSFLQHEVTLREINEEAVSIYLDYREFVLEVIPRLSYDA